MALLLWRYILKFSGTFTQSLFKAFYRGLGVILPPVLSIYVLIWIYNFIVGTIGEYCNHVLYTLLNSSAYGSEFLISHGWTSLALFPQLAGIIVACGLILTIGVLFKSYLAKKIWKYGESIVSRFPVLKTIYTTLRQVSDFILNDKKHDFSQVVAIEYPSQGIWSVGFLTNPEPQGVECLSSEELVAVFIPSSPTPFTGYVCFISKSKVRNLNMTVEDATKIIVSGGILVP